MTNDLIYGQKTDDDRIVFLGWSLDKNATAPDDIIFDRSMDLYAVWGEKPTAIGGMSREKLNAELQKSIDSLKQGSYTADEVAQILEEEYKKLGL